MADYVLEDCKLYLAGYDFSGDVNQMTLTYEAEIKDNTTFGSGGAREKLPGLKNCTLEGSGFWDNASGNGDQDDVMFDEVGTSEEVVTVCPTTGADGEIAFTFKSLLASYAPGEAIGEVLAFTVNAEGHDVLVRGTIMSAGAKTATGNGTARQLGAVGATQKLYATLHVLAASGTSPTLDVVIQSDDASGFVSPTSRITFTRATAIGSQWATPVSGAITDDWWRVALTIGGTSPSFTILVVIGIQ